MAASNAVVIEHIGDDDYSNSTLREDDFEELVPLPTRHEDILIEQLRRNDADLHSLDVTIASPFDSLYEQSITPDQVERLSDAIRANTTIQRLSLSFAWDHPPDVLAAWVTQAIAKSFTNAIAALPELKSIEISAFQSWGRPSEIPVEFLTSWLQEISVRQTEVSSLTVSQIYLSGSMTAFHALGEALQAVSSLRNLSLEYFVPDGDSAPGSSTPMTALLRDLPTLPNLHKLSLRAGDAQVLLNENNLQVLDPADLRMALQSHSLRKLCLTGFVITDEHLLDLQTQAQHENGGGNLLLEDIQLSFCHELTATTAVALSNLLLDNRCLERLKLTIRHPYGHRLDEAQTKHGTALLESLMGALKTNATLKTLQIQSTSTYHKAGSTISSKSSWDQLAQVLQSNTSLQVVDLSGILNRTDSQAFLPKISLYLKLNRLGRGRFFHQQGPGEWVAVEKDEWIDTFARCPDLDCVFCFLSLNPSLCQMKTR